MQRFTPHWVIVWRITSQHCFNRELIEIVFLCIASDIFPTLVGLIHDIAVCIHKIYIRVFEQSFGMFFNGMRSLSIIQVGIGQEFAPTQLDSRIPCVINSGIVIKPLVDDVWILIHISSDNRLLVAG